MVKSSKKQILEDEMKVLAELAKNSKENIDMIAKNCGFSRQKVWRVIKQLEASGMIWGYTVVPDQQKQGLQKFILSIKRSSQYIDKKTVEQMASMPFEKIYQDLGITILNSYYVHGEFDGVVIFTARSIHQAKKYAELLVNNYPNLIKDIRLSQILYTQKEQGIKNPHYLKLTDFL